MSLCPWEAALRGETHLSDRIYRDVLWPDPEEPGRCPTALCLLTNTPHTHCFPHKLQWTWSFIHTIIPPLKSQYFIHIHIPYRNPHIQQLQKSKKWLSINQPVTIITLKNLKQVIEQKNHLFKIVIFLNKYLNWSHSFSVSISRSMPVSKITWNMQH